MKRIILCLIVVLMMSSVLAEQVSVQTSINLSVSNDTLTVQTQSGTTTYSISSQLLNQNQGYTYSFTKDVVCPNVALNDNLANYTKQIVEICKINQEDARNCEAVYKANTELSFEILGLRESNTTLNEIQPLYGQCQNTNSAQISKIQELQNEVELIPSIEKQKYTWGIIGFILGALAYWYFKIKRPHGGTRSEKDLGRNADEDLQHPFPNRFDKKVSDKKGE